MHFTKKNSFEKRIELKNKLKQQKILKFPGAYNPLTAKLIAEIGFEGIYISGGVMANDLGIPDIGLTTLKEVSYRANQISRVTDLPAIVDADTGFGDCKKTIETFENLGLSGCHIEDQIDQKRCGHLDNKEIISSATMVNKIKTAVKAKKDKNFLVIARTDANSVEGLKKTIEIFEQLGLSGCHIEDQIDEKRCGHLDNKEIIPSATMVNKIKTAVKAKKDKNFLVIARTDANSVEGIKKTINRVKAYEDAGADIIFPEAMKDEKEFEQIRKNSKANLLANMTEFGKSKLLSANELENLGYNIVIYPVTTQRLAMKSVEDGLRTIMNDGHQNNIIDKMQTRKRLYELVEYEKYNTPDKKITDFKTDGHE